MIFYDNILKKITVMFLFLILINAAACASGQVDDDSKKGNKTLFTDNGIIVKKTDPVIIKNDDKNNVKNSDNKNINELLVNIKSYSTNGGLYQNKYEKMLISMAGEIIEGQDLDISKGSIGFYYDRKSSRTDRLFFGVDINTIKEGEIDYGKFSIKLIKENVSGIVDLMYKYKAILIENEIVGIVIGFRWTEKEGPQQVNIWIKKEDLHLFYETKITLNEMYQRSTITNTAGKIILLPI